MLANLILFSAIAATSLHPGESKIIEMDLDSALKGEVKTMKVDCNGPCQRVNVRLAALSGRTYLYVAQDFPPFLSGTSCSNCLCREGSYSLKHSCKMFSLKSDDFFFISVLAYSHYIDVKVSVEGPNVKSCNFYNLPSKVFDLGSAKKGQRRYFNATCHGPSTEVKAYVKALSGNPNLFVAKNAIPTVRGTKRCNNCFCAATGSGLTDRCQRFSLGDSSSFGISVAADTDYEKATLKVESFNLDDVTEISIPSQEIFMGMVLTGEARYFKVTCLGSCFEVFVQVEASIGVPYLFLAKFTVPQIRGHWKCPNCFYEATSHSLTNSCPTFSLGYHDSFYFAVETYKDSVDVRVKIQGFNFASAKEIFFPFVEIKLGSPIEGQEKHFKVTCQGRCSEVDFKMWALSGIPYLYAALDSKPVLQSNGNCKNCFCKSTSYGPNQSCSTFRLIDKDSFFITIRAQKNFVDGKIKFRGENLLHCTDTVTGKKYSPTI